MMDIIILIALGTLSRLVPHPANLTAVGGMALFSGAKYSTWKALSVVFATMFISDMILGFHSVMWATYGSLALAVFIGKWMRDYPKVSTLIGGIFASSVIFFIITNFAVWMGTSLYPKTFSGLIECYVMAMPFFRNSVIGDMFYSVLFFSPEYIFAIRHRILKKYD